MITSGWMSIHHHLSSISLRIQLKVACVMVKDSTRWAKKSKNGAIHIMCILLVIYFTINNMSELNGSTIMLSQRKSLSSILFSITFLHLTASPIRIIPFKKNIFTVISMLFQIQMIVLFYVFLSCCVSADRNSCALP